MACERPLGGLVAERRPQRPGLGLARPCLLSLRRKEDFGLSLSNCPGFESPGMQPGQMCRFTGHPLIKQFPSLHPNNLAPTPHTYTLTLTYAHTLPLHFYMVSWKAKPSWLLSLKHLSEMFHAGLVCMLCLSPSFLGATEEKKPEHHLAASLLHTNGNHCFLKMERKISWEAAY